MRSAARLPQSLLDVVDRESRKKIPVAEVCRRVGDAAEELGVARPSYERVRLLVHEYRRLNALRPTTAEVALDVMFRVRPPGALLDHAAGVHVPKLRR